MDDFNPKAAYDAGLVGCRKDPRADELFADSVLRAGGNPNGGEVAHEWEFAGAGVGALTMLWLHVEHVFPGCWPGPPQLWGDCVAKAAANCLLTSLCCEIVEGKPDEESGKAEGPPQLSTEGVKNIPVASESLWAWRGYDQDGWVCSEAAQVATEKGFLVRREYPELSIDLTKYTDRTIRIGGARRPSDKWLAESKKHRARTATVVRGREQVRDFLAAGYGIFNCSSMGFSDSRNEDGVSSQRGTWAHAQSFIGYDDRKETVLKYGQPLVAWLNQWGSWNSGPRRVMGTNYDLPHGAYWALASTIDRANCIALSSVAGWPLRSLPSYGATGNV
jgi:hypothetical protein